MTVRTAVEARRAAVEAPSAQSAIIEDAVGRHRDALERVLPNFLDRDQFEVLALQAITNTPGLVKCFATVEGETSVLAGIIQAASVGLRIDPLAKEAWLIPRSTRIKVGNGWQDGPWMASLQLDYRGVMKLARRDPGVDQILGDVVREGDEFDYWRDIDGDHLRHRPVGSSDRTLTHAYSIVRYSNGRALVTVLDRPEIERRRAVSSSYKAEMRKPESKRSGFWFEWEDRMWRKTAVHAARSSLDLAPEVSRVLASDDRVHSFDDNAIGWVDEPRDDPVAEIESERPAIEAATPAPEPPPTSTRAPGGVTNPTTFEEFLASLDAAGVKHNSAFLTARKQFPDKGLNNIEAVYGDPEAQDFVLGQIEDAQ